MLHHVTSDTIALVSIGVFDKIVQKLMQLLKDYTV